MRSAERGTAHEPAFEYLPSRSAASQGIHQFSESATSQPVCAFADTDAEWDTTHDTRRFVERRTVEPARGEPREAVWPTEKIDIGNYVEWLEAVIAQARRIEASGPMALFGASNAGAWLCGALPGWNGMFVDEDKNRIGNRLMDIPIVSPADVPAGTTVFVPLAHDLAARIAGRLSSDSVRYVAPGPAVAA